MKLDRCVRAATASRRPLLPGRALGGDGPHSAHNYAGAPLPRARQLNRRAPIKRERCQRHAVHVMSCHVMSLTKLISNASVTPLESRNAVTFNFS